MIDTVDALDVRTLARGGALRPGVCATIAWRQGQRSEISLGVACHDREIVLEYKTRHGSADWYPVRQEIALEWTPQPLGGKRVWFLCPACARRVALVYYNRHQGYVCRWCVGLPYRSQCQTRDDRLHRKEVKLRRHIGASADTHEPLWLGDKPKGMHWSTFHQVHARVMEVRAESDALWYARLVRLVARYVPAQEPGEP